jgi:hypothetical protein
MFHSHYLFLVLFHYALSTAQVTTWKRRIIMNGGRHVLTNSPMFVRRD